MRLALVSLFLAAIFLPSSSASAQMTKERFCTGWNAVCLRTCPRDTDCTQECTRRRATCMRSGCYFFRVPRPRCINNPDDLAMTNPG